jgi:hypothetical protein
MDKTVPEQNHGIIWCNSSVTNQDEMPRQSFCNWYHDIHIPDVLKTGAISKAYRYQAMDPAEDRFHLALYYADNMDGLLDKVKGTITPTRLSCRTKLLTAVSNRHDSIPGSHEMFDYAHFDTRFYKLVQLYEPEQAASGLPDFVLSTEMNPADADDFERWYQEEHLKDGSTVRGWRRTERYELSNALRTPDAPKYLTLVINAIKSHNRCDTDST